MKTFSTVSKRLIPNVLPDMSLETDLDLPNPPTPVSALLANAILRETGRTVLCITASPTALAVFHRDLRLMASADQKTVYYPAAHRQESRKKHEIASEDVTAAGHRLRALEQLSNDSSSLVVAASVQALLQTLPPPDLLSSHTLSLRPTDNCDRDALTARLIELNYEFTEEVLGHGQACVRGCIVDLWPPTAHWPVRLEIMGTDIESMRVFDPADQRSLGNIDSVTIMPPTETAVDEKKATDLLLSYLPEDTVVMWIDLPSIVEHAEMFESTSSDRSPVVSLDKLRKHIDTSDRTSQITLSDETRCEDLDIATPNAFLGIKPTSSHADAFEETRKATSDKLCSLLDEGYTVILSTGSEGNANHFFSSELIQHDGLQLHKGALSSGFVSETLQFIVVSENDLLPAKGISAQRYSPFGEDTRHAGHSGFRPAEITDLEPEDLVVHADHGIGIYKGINEISIAGELQEVLSLEYADGMILHVPVSQAHLLSRYVGLPHHKTRLHKLGGRRWIKEKDSAHQSIMDMASSLLDLQAHRAVQPGYAFSADKPWQRDFEAAFKYQETNDQLKAIAEVKRDLESPHPMDRLICGDAGYGKTEVAMRAAFKTVMDNRQVVLLVPTTVLAQQHFDTFSERMSMYPVSIAMLSRFQSRGKRQASLKGLLDGTIDIVIGTHALLQPGVAFKDLGLVIIDEEQRFGVEHKERLKQMRKLVDVLTMTATPIPRTLYLSMTGAREMSLIQTPPNERLPVKTVVAKNTDATVRAAINNELSREGQVFYLHNRIITIEKVYKRLATLLPDARIAVAHGRMAAGELSKVMHEFARGDLDVLLCTTIIESGLDIPRANTILIDRADRFGIADLYQLRGRVGRSTRKAYAYLLLPEHGHVDSDARSRIGAVKTFSGLAAGFNLALRDMEIRGVGNILGAEQSGHISAIGFGLYCQLLKRTVATLKGEKAPAAVTCVLKLDFISFTFSDPDLPVAAIPYTYIEEERLRLGLYRKIAGASTHKDIAQLKAELEDRFGPMDTAVARLLQIAILRIHCATGNVSELETRTERVMIKRAGDYVKTDGRFPRLRNADPDKKLAELIRMIKKLPS